MKGVIRLKLLLSLGAAIGAAMVMTGCVEKLDTTRQPVDQGSFGATVFTMTCQRVAYQRDLADGNDTIDVRGDGYRDACRNGGPLPAGAFAAVAALAEHRQPLIGAVDVIFPDAYLPDLQAYLTSNDFLRLYDDDTIGVTVDRTIDLFALLRDDADFAPALARLDGRVGYRPGAAALGALRAVTTWDGLDNMLLVFVDAISAGGAARGEFEKLQLAVSKQLEDASAPADRGQPERTLTLALDLLLTESPYLGNGKPRLLARRDDRGLVLVAADPVTGAMPPPFTDVDADGLADSDADGRFVLDGSGAAAPPFVSAFQVDTAPARDPVDGRALQFAAGPPLYQYVDLDKTVLAALVRDAKRLFDPSEGTGLDLLRGASALLGSRVTATHSYADGSSIDYRGYDAANAPLLDLLHAYLTLVNDPRIDDVLAFGRSLFVDHEPEAARLFEAILDVAELGDAYPSARVKDGAALYDDLVPVINQILATPGLAEDLLGALQDPQTRLLAHRFRDFMYYKDQIDLDPSTQQLVGSLTTPVDRGADDSGWNRSLMQRLLHLIADSSGVRMCNKEGAVVRDPLIGVVLATYAECELLQVDDLAVLYVQSIAYAKDASGNVLMDDGHPMPKAVLPLNLGWLDGIVTDDLMESESTIDGFRRHPTPAALNRVLLLDPAPAFIADTMAPAECKDGDRFIDAHTGTLPVWELNGFYDQIHPIVQAFADHDAEPLFVALLVALHMHYASPSSVQHQDSNPNGVGYSHQSNVQTYEPMLVEVVDNHDLWNALTESAAVLNGIGVPSGRTGAQVLANAARYLFTAQPGLAKRSGVTTTTTEDGRAVDILSPYYLLADAYQAKRAQVAASGPEGEAWERATGQFIDVLVRGWDTGGGMWDFKNPRFRGLSVALIDFLQDRITAHRLAGDLTAWALTDLPQRAEELLTGPVFAGVADFVLSLAATPEARVALEALHQHLFDEVGDEEAFETALTAVADLAQLFLDDPDMVPVARTLGHALAPDFGLVEAHLAFVRAARHADTNGTVARLAANFFGELAPGETSLAEVVEAVVEVHRELPFVDLGKPLSAADFRAVFGAVAEFLGDEQRGLKKFVRIVQERHL